MTGVQTCALPISNPKSNNSYGNKLVYSLDRGAGTILVTTFDLGLEIGRASCRERVSERV